VKEYSITIVLLLAQVHLFAQTANYQAAKNYDAPELQKKVGRLEVIPFFINKTDQCWFYWDEANGKRNHYFVDPVKKEKRLLYDKAILAEKLAALRHEKADTTAINFMPAFSGDGQKMIFSYKGRQYRYDFYHSILTEGETKTKPVAEGPWLTGNISPDKQWQLYSRNHNLYLKKTGDTVERKLSNDAEQYYSFCINEFDTAANHNMPSIVHWMDDSKHFYAIRQDNRKVQTISIMHAMAARPWVETKKYQYPGDKDVTQYELFIGNAATRQLMKVNTGKWPDQEIAVVQSKGPGKELFFTRKKRTGDEIELCAVNLATGDVRVIIHEGSKPHINPDLFHVSIIKNGKEIIWWSDRSGWGHYYRYDSVGHLKNQMTAGDWTAGKIVSIDTVKQEVYFYGYGKEPGRNPYLQHLYKASFNGKKQTLLTPENAHHKVFFTPSGNYFIDNYSRIDLEPQTILRDRNGQFIRDIVKPDLHSLYETGWKMPEPFTVKAADGITDLYGIMWKPYDFDPTKKYPIISQVYPGPFIETVWPDFTVFDKYNNTSLAQVGFIVVVMGHRGGSPYRNKAYATYGYNNLRDYALADDQYGLQQLARRFSFIDSNRVGIFGHSAGGAMAAAAICTYPDFYKVAVASAGNHDNNIYYRSWGETYQGIKEVTDTATGKTAFRFKTDVNQTLAGRLQGHLLLVTGEVDNNVHPANTFRMGDALIKAGKDFDMLVLPNQHHHYEGIYKTYFENKVRHYFGKYLIEDFNNNQKIK
jgi:dipeptidyl-peptidase-4